MLAKWAFLSCLNFACFDFFSGHGYLRERSNWLWCWRPDVWEDPVFAGRVSREQGELMGKIKSVNQFEQELIEHIEMLRLAREENDNELEMVSTVLIT
jgi:hypothetical protein